MLSLLERFDRTQFAPSLIVLSGVGPLADRVPVDCRVMDLRRSKLRGALPALRRTLSRDRPELVFSTMAHLNSGVLALRPFLPRSIRYVVREANIPLKGLTGLKRSLQRMAYRLFYPCADAIICPSTRVADSVSGIVARAAKNISVIHNPVDVEALRQRAGQPIRDPGQSLRLVAVGRLTVQKGFDRIIGLMPDLHSDVHLTIVGDGPDRSALEARIEHHSLLDRVTMAGYLENPGPLVAGADALLLPSRWEGLPNVALEALALGIPVIATPEAGGIDEIATAAPNAVSLAEIGDPFINAIRRVKPRPAVLCLSESLLPEQFEIDTIVARYEALFREVVA